SLLCRDHSCSNTRRLGGGSGSGAKVAITLTRRKTPMQNPTPTLIEVTVVYPSAHHPAAGSFAPETLIRQVKQFALDQFGLKEETIDGNQIFFFLFQDRTKIENL